MTPRKAGLTIIAIITAMIVIIVTVGVIVSRANETAAC